MDNIEIKHETGIEENVTKQEPEMDNIEIKHETGIEENVTKQEPEMSKNQKKKLLKLEKKASLRHEKRKKEREQRKLKGKINLCVKEDLNGEIVQIKRKTLKNNLMENSTNKLRIVIDCSFESLMNECDTHHLGKQLSYCYARNRRMTSPLQFYITRYNFFIFILLCLK
jgi:hypothetical protein